MILIKADYKLADFPAWGDAIDTKTIIEVGEKETQFESLVEEIYPDGITAQQLNDLLWHDADWLLAELGLY